jgi:molybdate transport system substrate-binding protein
MPRRLRSLAAVVLAVSSLVGCGSGEEGASSSPAAASGAGAGAVTVLAAASLTDAVRAGNAALDDVDDDWAITPVFGGSQDLVRQIAEGAPGDAVALADTRSMEALVDAGLVDDPQVFATNRLAIAVAPGNPEHVAGVDDLDRDDLTVVLADPSVPVGRYAAQVLDDAGVDLAPSSLELDARATLAKVTSGDADAAIVYLTDISSSEGKADPVEIPDDQNVVAEYPIAVIAGASHRAAAEAYVREVVSGRIHEALVDAGFGAAP